MYQGIPIIGIVGGVGSGKSHVARIFRQFGCCVIHSDDQVTLAYQQPDVRSAIRREWGEQAFADDGALNRRYIAARVFASPEERQRLEAIVHPAVARLRDAAMRDACGGDKPPVAFVWDTPLLFEAGLADRCDAVVFVDAPAAVRQRRVRETRGWDETELARRENSQWPLDKKRALSHYVLTNAAFEVDSVSAPPVPATPTEVRPPEAVVDGNAANGRGPAVQAGAASQPEVSRGDLNTQVRLILSRILHAVGNPDGHGTDQGTGL